MGLAHRIGTRLFFATLCLLAFTAPSYAPPPILGINARPRTTPPPTPTYPQTYYQGYSGWTFPFSQFPIGLFDQSPADTANNNGGTNAAAAVAYGMPIFFGHDGWQQSTAGTDDGSMTALKNAGGYLIAGQMNSASNTTGTGTCNPPTTLNNRCTVANALAIAATYSAVANLIAYQIGDEPECGSGAYSPPTRSQPEQSAVPTAITTVNGYDSTRLVVIGQKAWVPWYVMEPGIIACLAAGSTALSAPNLTTYDDYAVISPFDVYISQLLAGAHEEVSDCAGLGSCTHSNDSVWAIGMGTKAALEINAANGVTKPSIGIINSGGDALGYSSLSNSIDIDTVSGTKNIIVNSGNSAFAKLSDALYVHPPGGSALTITSSGGCFPSGTTLSAVSDATHGTTVANASTTGTCTVLISGGTAKKPGMSGFPTPNGDTGCNVSLNACAPRFNEYRDTDVQVMAEEWAMIINGALQLDVFCHDVSANSFCLGDPSASGTGNPAAAAGVAANLAYVHGIIQTYAAILQQVPVGIVTMQSTAGTTTTTGTNGILTFATGTTNCPGSALAHKRNSDNHYFVFAQTARASWSATNCGASSGATFTTTLSGVTGTAHVVYDSNSQYDAGNDTTGATHALTAGVYTDTLGDHGNSYRVKIYEIY